MSTLGGAAHRDVGVVERRAEHRLVRAAERVGQHECAGDRHDAQHHRQRGHSMRSLCDSRLFIVARIITTLLAAGGRRVRTAAGGVEMLEPIQNLLGRRLLDLSDDRGRPTGTAPGRRTRQPSGRGSPSRWSVHGREPSRGGSRGSRCLSASRDCRSARRRRSTAGRVTRARAHATRCCSPPDRLRRSMPQPVFQSHRLDDRRQPLAIRPATGDGQRQPDVLLRRQRRQAG